MTAAAAAGDLARVRALVASGVPLEATDGLGLTPLMVARTPEIVGILLDAGARADARAPDGSTPLHKAWADQDGETAARLIDHGGDLLAENVAGETPLGCALNASLFVVARILVDRQQRVGRVPVPDDFVARAGVSPELAEAFVRDTVARADGTGRLVSLLDAIELGRVHLVCESVRAGARLDVVTVDGQPPLVAAVNDPKAGPEVVRVLLEAGVDPNLTDRRGRPPLEIARRNGRREMFELLGGCITDDLPTDALARGIHELVIVDNNSFTVRLNPNTLTFAIEQRLPRAEEGWGTPTVKDIVDGPAAAAEQRGLEKAGAGWLLPFLRRLAHGEFVRIAEIEYAGGASGFGRPVARAFDGTKVRRDPTWKGPSPS